MGQATCLLSFQVFDFGIQYFGPGSVLDFRHAVWTYKL